MKKTLLVLIIHFVSISLFSQEVPVRPNWKVGDKRLSKNIVETTLISGSDTILNTSGSSTYSIEVEDRTKNGFIISHSESTMDEMDFGLMGLDTLEEAQPFFLFMSGFIEILGQSVQSVKVKYEVDSSGEAVELHNFDLTYEELNESIIDGMENLSIYLKEQMGDTFSFDVDPEMIKTLNDSKKEEMKETFLNSINYINQAYSVYYDKSEKVLQKAVIREINVYKYGRVEIEGTINSKVLENNSKELKVEIITEYDQNSLNQAVVNEFGAGVSEYSIIEDKMIVSFDKSDYWIKTFEAYQEVASDSLRVINYELVNFSE